MTESGRDHPLHGEPPEPRPRPDPNGSAPQTVDHRDPDNELPLTVGHLRRAIDGYDDETQMFVQCHDYSDRAIVWVNEGLQIPWSNPDWKSGDPLVVGIELDVGRYEDEPPRDRKPRYSVEGAEAARDALTAAADSVAAIPLQPRRDRTVRGALRGVAPRAGGEAVTAPVESPA